MLLDWLVRLVSIERLGKKTFLILVVEFSLALCLIYLLFYLASSLGLHYFVLSNRGMVEQTVSGSILSGPLDIAVWGIAIFVVLVWLGYNLGLKNDRRCYRSSSTLGVLVLLFGLVVGVCLVVFGLVGQWVLVLISSVL